MSTTRIRPPEIEERPAPQPPATPQPSRKTVRRRRRNALILCLFAFVFVAKLANYVFPEAIRFPSIGAFVSSLYEDGKSWVDNSPLLHSCPSGLRMQDVSGGYVCATQAPSASELAQIRRRIFDRYPLDGGVHEAIYASTRQGSVSEGKDLLRGVVDVPRYRPVGVNAADRWRADPYKAVYWRLFYYSLRPTVNLLAAFQATGDRRYAEELLAIDESFFRAESTSPWAWADSHAVAFRALVLTYEWWELRRLHALTLTESAQFLAEIQKTAGFLVDRNHYQPEMNHGTNESAALLEMAVDFPSLPGASGWLSLSRERLAQSLHLLLDADGQLIENSPYYHFYELDKYWQIYQFSLKTHTPIASDFRSRLTDMVRYATYILQPDDSVPLLGASLEQTIHAHGTYQAIADEYPQFNYVLTQGRSGQRPTDTSRLFPASGRTVMRSGWGTGAAFTNQSYLTFNVGKYRTDHSHLDALAFTLYDNGKTLLPGPGLYTYAYDQMRAYFHGTSAHNTVVVDGHSQEQGDAYAGPLIQRNGMTWQSGQSSLYEGVDHQRTLMMIDKNHFLVIDRLHSSKPHTYQQMFHVFPGATVRRNGLSVSASDSSPSHTLQITQLEPGRTSLQTSIGRYTPPSGLCSTRYQIAVGCEALAYTQHSANASYATLLSVGKPDPRFQVSYDSARDSLTVHDDGRLLQLTLGETRGITESVTATHPKAPVAHSTPLPGTASLSHWQPSGSGSATATPAADDGGAKAVAMNTGKGQEESITDPSVRANLSASNLQVRLKVTNAARVRSLTLALSNYNFRASASIEMLDSYQPRYSGDWMTISLGRESPVVAPMSGSWELRAGRFDWGSVDGVRLTMRSQLGPGPAPTVQLQSVSSMPQPRTGVVSFVFDDGYESILPAAAAMHARGMAGSVAVIGRAAEVPFFKQLNLYELRMLQNQLGWNMVNHTQWHVDAVGDYFRRRAFGAYEQDVLDGATFLERAGLNSAPNWLVYPHGTTNTELERVVSRFYTFARTTNTAPEAFPFGSPLRVKTLELHAPGDSGDGAASALTPPDQVVSAARDALRYHDTLIVTLHRIDALPTDSRGYPLTDFVQILNGIKRLHIPVRTLSGLDRMNGVPETAHITVRPAKPSLITVSVVARGGGGRGVWLPPAWMILVATLTLTLCARAVVLQRTGRAAHDRRAAREREHERV